jgi:adenine deaminase
MAANSFRVSGNIVDLERRRIYPGTVVVQDGRIAELIEDGSKYEAFLAPGFIDAHVHIESSMLVPSEFARLATVHGTVATVSDPHEIANVCGIPGIDYMLASAARAPLKVMFGAPSCVPATPFDHAGAHLGPKEIETLLSRSEIGYLSEMMNYPGVVYDDPEVAAKLAIARRIGKPIDGHAPGLRGDGLRKYVASGITTDHECVAIDEAREKISLGMHILIREGSAAKNFEALWPLLNESPERCMLCSDDKHPNDLVEGHIDELVRRLIAKGVNVFDAWRAASTNPIEHYRLKVGRLRVGDPADFIELSDLSSVRVRRTWIDGVRVAENGKPLLKHQPAPPINKFATKPKKAEQFVIEAAGVQCRVIEALDGQLIAGELIIAAKIAGGHVHSDVDRDVLKIALVDRYNDTPPAMALIKNFGLKRGAIASSVSHDSHNIIAVGVDDEDLAAAVNLLIAESGGLSLATGERTATLPLPIAGLMSGEDGYRVGTEYAQLDKMVKEMGSTLTAPYMTLSFMALTVIPALKLGPEGLFDVLKFAPVSLFVDA